MNKPMKKPTIPPKMKSRAAEYNDNQMMLGMSAPRVWVASEDEPFLKVWAAHSRSKKLMHLANNEPNGSAKLLMMAGGYLAAPLSDAEYELWKSSAETMNDDELMEMVEDAVAASQGMEDNKRQAEKHRINERAEDAMRSDARAYSYAVLLKAIRTACESITGKAG